MNNKGRPARRIFVLNVVLCFQETRVMAFPSSFLSFSSRKTIYGSSISFLAIVFLLSNQVGNSQALEGVVTNQHGMGLHNQG